ncbi:hypothetical protein Taro_052014 [Colocasia esculenta]|uniref:Uncharacterized protein n=1 Tax=Colocasia esculenta TaxID=4460 RepID=A0A843XHG7_COLES|nr:hypothetical protein [Colocasia esculenta]
MASALVNNVGPVAPEGFLDLPPSATTAYSSFGWLSPRISFSRDFDDDDKSKGSLDAVEKPPPPPLPASPSRASAKAVAEGDADLGSPGRDLVVDFEFRRLDDPVTMLPADELFSDGKLVPLQLAPVRPAPDAAVPAAGAASAAGARSPEASKLRRRAEDVGSDPYAVFSPKAPRCSSRWRELLGLKKVAQSGGAAKAEAQRMSSLSSSSPLSSAAPSASTRTAAARSLKHFLHRNAKSSSSMDASLSLPLLRDSECESVSISARLSLSSSSSSGPDHEDLPRLSLDSDKPSLISISLGRNPPRVRLTPKPRPTVDPSSRPCSQVADHLGHHSALAATPVAGAGGKVGRSPMRRAPGESAATPADSPRMNSSGKVVFQSLERSSSSPSTFNGGPRVKHRGMERSYSANVVRVTPVLNVPVCSLRGSSKSGSVFGFGQLFSSSPHKKDGATGASSSSVAARNSSCGSGRSGKIVRA